MRAVTQLVLSVERDAGSTGLGLGNNVGIVLELVLPASPCDIDMYT